MRGRGPLGCLAGAVYAFLYAPLLVLVVFYFSDRTYNFLQRFFLFIMWGNIILVLLVTAIAAKPRHYWDVLMGMLGVTFLTQGGYPRELPLTDGLALFGQPGGSIMYVSFWVIGAGFAMGKFAGQVTGPLRPPENVTVEELRWDTNDAGERRKMHQWVKLGGYGLFLWWAFIGGIIMVYLYSVAGYAYLHDGFLKTGKVPAGADVAVISKIHPVRSHSGAAEGGINAALGNASDDNPEKHAFDTVKGSDYLGDQDAIEVLCEEAPGDVYQLEHWGAVFSRTEDGRIAQRPFGAAGEPRTAYAADITGHVLVHVLYEQVMKRDIFTYEEYFAWKLVIDDDRCQGVIAWDLLNGGLKAIGAKTVILATGGAGRLYAGTTNAYACTGDGMAMALRVGVPLKDMEMMQFHPTTLSPSGVLITEGCRGEGAYLLNGEGDRFLKRYAPKAMELASRDVISRAEQTEIDEGRGVDGDVLLDLRHLGRVV